MNDDSPSTSGSTTAHDHSTDLYCTHKVTKLDTLAGIAVRYNVNVSDIKRANGLLSDTAMFAKDSLLIPTRSLPIGQEYATIAGMIVTQYGRPVHLPGHDLEDRGSQVSSALDQLRGYYGLGSASPSGSGSPHFFRVTQSFANGDTVGCQLHRNSVPRLSRMTFAQAPLPGLNSDLGGSEDGRSMPRLGDVGRSDSGEVEMTDFQRPGPSSEEAAGTQAALARAVVCSKLLQELLRIESDRLTSSVLRSTEVGALLRYHASRSVHKTTSCSGCNRQVIADAESYQIDDRLRRRNTDTSPARGSGLEGDTCLGTSGLSGDSQEAQALQHSRSSGRPPTTARFYQPRGPGSAGRPKKESLFQRIKRAASQPALAGPSAPAVSQVAQSAIASVASITSDSSFTTLQRAGSATQGSRGKDAKKD